MSRDTLQLFASGWAASRNSRGVCKAGQSADICVDTRGLLPVAALQDELQELLGERFDVVPQEALAPHVAANAPAEAVPL